jgi:hypothetical protein
MASLYRCCGTSLILLAPNRGSVTMVVQKVAPKWRRPKGPSQEPTIAMG